MADVTRDLVILGTSGNSLEILDAVIEAHRAGLSPRYRVIGLLDDNPAVHGTSRLGVPVLGGLSEARQIPDAMFINGIASTRTYRRKPSIIGALGLSDERFATVLHPSAVISNFAIIGAGTAVLANVVVGACAKVGRHVHVLPLSVLSHDVEIGDFATIASSVSLSGFVKIGRASYIGAAASIRGNVRVGEESLVGMGAVVLKDVNPGAIVAGVPAAELPTKS